MDPSPELERILEAALAVADLGERAMYVEEACRGDAALRAEVESLLAAHDRADGFMRTRAMSQPGEVPLSERPGDRIGHFKLLEVIGEGGFGVVWMAEQEEPVRRRVALKIIKLGMDTREVVARFEAERQALALMDHPNIASVFDGGATATGRPYFVMELVKGFPITDYCDANKLSPVQRLELFMQVCQAVQHAHQKGIIHRDLKPTNVLVTVKDDRPVPKVIDFGVAKATQARLTEKTLFTRFHQWIGTPAYMSPEQAGLASVDVDTRSDVYSLGVLLYELLTGRTPFDTRKLLELGYEAVLRTIREEEPPKPSTRLSSLSEEELPEGRLEWQRAMSEVRLCNVASGQKLQQVRLRTTNLTQLAVSPLGTYIVAAYADGAVEVMDGRLRIQQRPGSSSSRVMPVIKPLATIVQIGELPEPPEMNESGAPPNAGRVMPHSGRVNSLAISPDEKFLVTAGADGNTLIHTLPSGQCTRVQRANGSRQGTPNDAVLQVAFSPDGRRIATLTGAGTVEFWNVPQGGAVGPLDHPIPGATSLVFSPDGRFVAVSKSGEVRVWDVTSGQPASAVLMHAAAVTSVSFNPDGTLLLTASLDGGVRLWDLTSALPSTSPLVDARLASRPATRSQSSRDPLISCFSPDEARVATVADAGSVRVWESATGRPITPVIRPGVDTDSMAFSHDGGRLVVAGGGSGGRVQVFDATSGAAISPVLVLDTLVRHLAFTPDDRCLVITGVREALMFDAVSGAAVPVPVPSAPPIRDLAFSADGRWVASCSEAPASEAEPACVWEVNVRDVATRESSGSPLRIPGVRVEPFSGSAPELAFSEDSRWLAVKCWRGLPSTMAEHAGPKWHAFVTELRRGAAFTPVPGDFMGCFFAIHPDRLFLLNGRTGNTVVRDLAHGENVTVRQPQEYDCVPREVSRNGAWLLGSTQGGWRIWELATGEAVTPILEDVLDAGPDTQRACFRSDGGVVLAGTFMMPRLWPVVPDRRPVDAIARGVQLLAARELDEFGSMVPLSPARLMELWHSEGASHVVTGGASTNQVVWWHLCQAGRSERSGDWFAAEFHLSRLLDTSGDGTQTRQRLAQARNQTLFELLNRTQ